MQADQPPAKVITGSRVEFWHWAELQKIDSSRFPAHDILKPDLSHPAMAVNLDACIDCGRAYVLAARFKLMT